MQLTTTMPRTDVTQAARYLGNRVLGDLLAIREKFGVSTERELRDLAHDVEIGLRHDCLNSLSLFLFPKGWVIPHTAYVYHRVAPGTFRASSRSGRIARCSMLVGGSLSYEVSLRDKDTWYILNARSLRIAWSPCVGQSTDGMFAKSDGGYASGDLGFSRTCLRRGGF